MNTVGGTKGDAGQVIIYRDMSTIELKFDGKVVKIMGCRDDVPKMQVKCGVENCHYNKGRMCHADAIEINAIGDGKAETSDGTCCSTFKNGKNSK